MSRFKTKTKRVAVYFCTGINQCMYPEDVEVVLDFCEEEGMSVILLAQEETIDGTMDLKGYETLHELFARDMIDGVVTFTEDMLNSKQGRVLLDEVEKGAARFVLSYFGEINRRRSQCG